MKRDLNCGECTKKLGEISGSDFALEMICKRCKAKNRFEPQGLTATITATVNSK